MNILAGLQARDPDLLNLRKATRAVLVCVPLFAGLKIGLGLGPVATYSFFSSFVGLVFADFGGAPRPRILAYIAMIVVGDLVIVAGSLLSGDVLGAAVAMFVVMFAATFATVFGGYAPAFIAPVALAYSLTVLDPLTNSSIDVRVLGWTIGGAAALIAANVLWPVDRRQTLRQTLGALSGSLADALESIGDRKAAEAALQRTSGLLADARNKTSAPLRPSGPLSRDIGLLHLVEQLEQASDMIRQVIDGGPAANSDAALVAACAAALRESGDALLGRIDASSVGQSMVALDRALDDALRKTDRSTMAIAAAKSSGDDQAASGALAMMQRSFPVFALSHIAGWVNAAAAAALGVRATVARPGAVSPAEPASDRPVALLGRAWRIAASALVRDTVILRNSIRSATAMTLAVVLAKLLPVEHGFWITLGALLVLRSSAAATSATAMQAVAGTLVGFVVAAALLTLADHSATVLWIILPLTVFLAGFTPGAIGFVVGQASFTTALVVLFTLIAPAGITTAVVRVETVSLGAVSAAVIGLILWPRGARAALAEAVAAVYRAAASGLRAVVTGSEERCQRAAVDMHDARRRADEAFGVALTERGRHLDARLWLELFQAPNLAHSMVSGLLAPLPPSIGEQYGAGLAATTAHRDHVADRLDRVADKLDPGHAASEGGVDPGAPPDPIPILMDCFDHACTRGSEAVEGVRQLIAWNWWLSFLEKELESSASDLDVVVAVSKPRAWLRWSVPKLRHGKRIARS